MHPQQVITPSDLAAVIPQSGEPSRVGFGALILNFLLCVLFQRLFLFFCWLFRCCCLLMVLGCLTDPCTLLRETLCSPRQSSSHSEHTPGFSLPKSRDCFRDGSLPACCHALSLPGDALRPAVTPEGGFLLAKNEAELSCLLDREPPRYHL